MRAPVAQPQPDRARWASMASVSDSSRQRLYSDLAVWWPLISPPEDYAEEAAFCATVLASADIPVGEVLELGSGGGHNAFHLKGQFAMTLVDLRRHARGVTAAQPRLRTRARRHAHDSPGAATSMPCSSTTPSTT
jgi:hypothetical protein